MKNTNAMLAVTHTERGNGVQMKKTYKDTKSL